MATFIPSAFIERLLFMTRREAQRILDRYYPGWYIKMGPNGTARIYSPQRVMVCKIQGDRK